MHRLILLRHAKAESTAVGGGDFERGLTERGRRDAALMGRALAQAGLSPNRVLVSQARRAQETWDEVARAFPTIEAEESHDLYLASCERLAQLVSTARAAPTIGTLLIIGHNPGLHEFAISFLSGRGAPSGAHDMLLAGFPTASAAVFAFDAAGAGVFERQMSPRDFGGGPL